MTSNAFKRIGSFFMAILMILGTVPAYVLAENGIPMGFSFQEFAALGISVREQSVALGTSRGELDLPDTLRVVYANESTQKTVAIPVEEWESDPTYEADKPDTYIFTPVIADEDFWELPLGASGGRGIDYPKIRVTVREAPLEGTASRTIVLEVPDPFPDVKPDGTPNGDALATAKPLAKQLWDILEELLYDDDTAHVVEIEESRRPQVDLGTDYTPQDLDTALDGLVDEFIRNEIAQPAADAFWADFPSRYWLKEEMGLELRYTIDDNLLTLEIVAFGFGYYAMIMPLAFDLNDDVWVYDENGPYESFDTIDNAIAELNNHLSQGKLGAESNLRMVLPRANYTWNANYELNLFCKIMDAGEGVTPVISIPEDKTLSFNDGIHLENILFEDEYYINIEISKASPTSKRTQSNLTNVGLNIDSTNLQTFKIRVNTDRGNSATHAPTLDLTNVRNLVEVTGFDNVTINSEVIVNSALTTSTLTVSSGSTLKFLMSNPNSPISIEKLSGTGAIHYLPQAAGVDSSRMRFIAFTSSQPSVTGDISLYYEPSSNGPYTPTKGDAIIQMETGVALEDASLDNIKLIGNSFVDNLFMLKHDSSTDQYVLEVANIAVYGFEGNSIRRRGVFESFDDAADFADTISSIYRIVMYIRRSIDQPISSMPQWKDVTITSDMGSPITNPPRPYVLGSSGSTFPMNQNVTLQNIVMNGSVTTDGNTLTLAKGDNSDSPVTILGDVLGGAGKGTLHVTYESAFDNATGLDNIQINLPDGQTASVASTLSAERIEILSGTTTAPTITTLSGGTLAIRGETQVTSDTITAGTLTVGDDSTVQVSGTLTTTGDASVGDSQVGADTVVVTGELRMASATITTVTTVTAGTVDSTGGGTIVYSGAIPPASSGGYILALTSTNTMTLGGTLTFQLTAPPSDGAGIVRTVKDVTVTDIYMNVAFSNSAYDGYALIADDIGSYTYYKLGQIMLYVSDDNTEVPYTSFDSAVADINAGRYTGDISILLYNDIAANAHGNLPNIATTITTYDGRGTASLGFNTNLYINGKTTFTNINLVEASSGALTLHASNGTTASHLILGAGVVMPTNNTNITGLPNSDLTILENAVVATNSISGIGGTIAMKEGAQLTVQGNVNAFGNFTVASNAKLTVQGDVDDFVSLSLASNAELTVQGDIKDFSGLSVTGGTVTAKEITEFTALTLNGAKLTLDRLHDYSSLDVTANSDITLTSAYAANQANIEMPQTVTGNGTVTLYPGAGFTPAEGQLIVQAAVSSQTDLSKITTVFRLKSDTQGQDFHGFSLKQGTTSAGYDYYELVQWVGEIKLEMSSGSYTYGDTVSATATLYDPSGTNIITSRNGEDVSFTLTPGGETWTTQLSGGVAPLTIPLTLDVKEGGYELEALYVDLVNGSTSNSDTAHFTIDRKALTPVGVPENLKFEKRYDGTPDIDYDANTPSRYLGFNQADLVGSDTDVRIATAQIAFTDKDVSRNASGEVIEKDIVISGISLAGTQSGNYTIADTITLSGTGSRILPAFLLVNGTVEKAEYDGTADLLEEDIDIKGLYVMANSTLIDLYGSDDVTVDPAAIAAAGTIKFASRHVHNNGLLLYNSEDEWILSGSDKDNYEVYQYPRVGSILPKGLEATVTVNTPPIIKVFDGTADATLLPGDASATVIPNEDAALLAGVGSVEITGAEYDSAEVGVRDVLFHLALSITDADYQDDFYLKENRDTVASAGEITKAVANPVNNITIRIPSDTPVNQPQSFDLSAQLLESFGGLAYPPNTTMFKLVGSYSGSISFIQLEGTESGLVYSLSTVTNSADATATFAIESDRYQDINFDIYFVIMDITPVEIDTDVSGRVYDATADEPFTAIRVTESGGAQAQIDRSDLIILYTGSTFQGSPYMSAQPPKDAGEYEVTISVREDTLSPYQGSGVFPFTIQRRDLTVTPADKEMVLGDAIPTWSTAGDFHFDSFAPGEDWSLLFSEPVPQVVVAGLTASPQAAGSFQVKLADYTHNNYTVSGQTATLTVTGAQVDASWLVFDPASPDGDNGWYVTPISVTSSAVNAYTMVGRVNSTLSPSSKLIINEQTTGDRTVELYLHDPVTGYSTQPYPFQYRLDNTRPELIGSQFTQHYEQRGGVLSITLVEEHSGIRSVTATSPSGVVTPLQPSTARTAGTQYTCEVDESGVYTITMTDNAGNQGLGSAQVEISLVSDFEIRQDGRPVSYIYTDISEGTVLEAVVTRGNAVAGVDFDFDWSSSNTNVVTVDQSGRVTPTGLGRAVVTVEALDLTRQVTIDVATVFKPDPVDPPTDPGGPGVVIPPEIVPPGIDYEDLRIIIEPLDEATTALMQASILANSSNAVERFLKDNTAWRNNTQWMRIRLVDAANGYRDVEVRGNITIYLPYPAGSSASDIFMLMHMPGDSALYTAYSKTQQNSVRFTVDQLGPFSLSWKQVGGGGSSGGSSGGGSGGRGYGSYASSNSMAKLSSDFWARVIAVIQKAQTGNKVVARPFAYIQTCPATVLRALAGKDLTLVIHWTGETIVIYGLDLIPPADNIYMYTLEELAEIYGISKWQTAPTSLEDLHNPVTGGDDIVMLDATDNVILTASAPRPSSTMARPVIPQLAQSDTAAPPMFVAGPLTEEPDQQTRAKVTIITFSGVLLAAIIGCGILRRNDFRPVDDVVTIPGDAATAATIGVTVPTILLEPIAEPKEEAPPPAPEAVISPDAQEALYDNAMEPIIPNAAPSAQPPVMRQPARPANPREAARMAADAGFFQIVNGHKKLQQLLLDGRITREEYESKKRMLVMFS